MRLFYYLTALTVLLAGVSGYLLWQTYVPVGGSDGGTAAQVSLLKSEFLLGRKPLFEIPLEEYQQTRKSLTLADPKTALPQIASFPFTEVSSLSRYVETCSETQRLAIHSAALRKTLLWHRFLCKKITALPDDFFESGYLMHPSGSSYVRLALLSGRKEFSDAQWIKSHQTGLHLLEILRGDGYRAIGLNVSAFDLQSLLSSDDLVMTSNHVLFALKNTSPVKSTPKYMAFRREDWDKFVSSKDLMPSANTESSSCLLRESNICWIQNPERQTSIARKAAVLLFLGFAILAIGLVSSIVRRSRTQKSEAAQRLFTLQMLTHELRTPATAIRLAVESQRREFDSLPADSQRAFLQICDELGRLDRVVEASRTYLKSQESEHLFEFARTAPISVNNLIADALEPYLNRITYRPLDSDKIFRLDRYWIELCLKNLVENALSHGKPPVVVSLSEASGEFYISVEDHGSVSFKSFEEMAAPFRKSNESHGLGLGLAIVKKVVEAMNGELIFETTPTRFLIKLRQVT